MERAATPCGPDLLGIRTNGVDDLALVTAVAEVKKMVPGEICWDSACKRYEEYEGRDMESNKLKDSLWYLNLIVNMETGYRIDEDILEAMKMQEFMGFRRSNLNGEVTFKFRRVLLCMKRFLYTALGQKFM